jgi:hypothetical protein
MWCAEDKFHLIQDISNSKETSEKAYLEKRLKKMHPPAVLRDPDFPAPLVHALHLQPRVSPDIPVKFVHVYINPFFGDFAMVSICGPDVILLGMEAIPITKHDDYTHLMIDHMRMIRMLPKCQNCVFVVSVEAGTGAETAHITKRILDTVDNVIFLKDHEGKPGVETTKEVKEKMMDLTKRHLRLGEIYISGNFVCTELPSVKKDAVIQRFIKQMAASPPVTVSECHELCDAFQRCIYSRDEFLNSGKYDDFHV